jgi:hypothetical protein
MSLRTLRSAFLTVVLVGLIGLACQEPAGLPSTLESGVVTFELAGPATGTFTAEGRCYWSQGYPPADTACALALDLGDTVRIRAVRDPRTAAWQHMNLEFPASGECGEPGACRMAMEYLNAAGALERSFLSTETEVTVLDEREGWMSGTFSGRMIEVNGVIVDTIQIVSGAFDVPVVR